MSISQLYIRAHGWISQIVYISFGGFKQQIINDVHQFKRSSLNYVFICNMQ